MHMIVLTEEHIEQLRTPAGGFNKETMEIIGAWPLSEGWKERLVGQAISNRAWSEVLKARLKVRHFFRGNTRRRG